MSIKTDVVLKDINNKELVLGDNPGTVGRYIATALVSEQQVDPLRAYTIANTIIDRQEIQLSDIDFIKSALKQSKLFTPLVTGQSITILDDLVAQEKLNKKKNGQ